MNTLLLRLIGPMQAWGVQSQHKDRDTGLEPSKSGVVGLLAAALGRERDKDISDLAALRFGARVDRQGQRLHDYHTAFDVYKADNTPPPAPKHPKFGSVSKRAYLADAAFLVGVESETAGCLQALHNALRQPRWPLFLGRRAFVPSAPPYLKNGLRLGETLEEALQRFPWLGRAHDDRPSKLRVILDADDGHITRPDYPLSFALFSRQYAPRRVKDDFYETSLERLEDC